MAQALSEWRGVLGEQWVMDSEIERASYLDPFDIEEQDEHASAAALSPADTDQLREVLAIANRRRIPLWPVSMGKNFAYGTAAPEKRGTVILDLKRMNRVLEVNEALGYAVVEPGVSFFDFKEELDRRRSGLWMSGPSHSWGSVIGNALEHGVGYTPYGIHADTICGMEVMLADGTLVRTGFGAVEGSQEWQAYKWPYGPMLDGMFTQSNFAIVTKMGLWLMPEPEEMAGVAIQVPRKESLADLIDTLRPLRLDQTINAAYTLENGWRQITGGSVRDEIYDGPGAIPADVVARLLDERGRGWWRVTFNLFDHAGGIDLRLERIARAFAASLPEASIETTRWRKGEEKPAWLRQGVSLAPLGIADWRGSPGGHTDFAPVTVPVGSRVSEIYEMTEARFLQAGIDPWIGAFGIDTRAIVFVADMFYRRTDAELTARCRALFRQLLKDAEERGVSVYRTHLSFMRDAQAAQNWNGHALPALNARIKAALDPNGIIAPGKQGIGT